MLPFCREDYYVGSLLHGSIIYPSNYCYVCRYQFPVTWWWGPIFYLLWGPLYCSYTPGQGGYSSTQYAPCCFISTKYILFRKNFSIFPRQPCAVTPCVVGAHHSPCPGWLYMYDFIYYPMPGLVSYLSSFLFSFGCPLCASYVYSTGCFQLYSPKDNFYLLKK